MTDQLLLRSLLVEASRPFYVF